MKNNLTLLLVCMLALFSLGCQAQVAFLCSAQATFEEGAPSDVYQSGANGMALGACTVDSLYLVENILTRDKTDFFEYTTTAIILANDGFTILATAQSSHLLQQVTVKAMSRWSYGWVHDEASVGIELAQGSYKVSGQANIDATKTGDFATEQIVGSFQVK